MKSPSIRSLVLLLLATLVFPFQSTLADTARLVQASDTTVYDFVFFDSRYQNQYAFWGRNYGQQIPFSTVNFLYYFHSKVWIGVYGFRAFEKAVPFQTGISIGYYKEFTPKADWHISYSQFYIPDSAIPRGSRAQGYLQTTVGLEWKILYSTLQGHLLVNNTSDVFFTTTHSRYFQFNKKLFKKIKVSFEPKVSFTVGTHQFDYSSEEVVTGPGGGPVISPKSSLNGGSQLKPLNYDFLLPLKFDIGKFTLEPSWRYTVPLNIAEDDPSKPLHVFAVALSYYIPVKKRKQH